MQIKLFSFNKCFLLVLLVLTHTGCKPPNPEGVYTYTHQNGAVEKLVLKDSNYTQEITSGTLTLYKNSSTYKKESFTHVKFEDFLHPSWEIEVVRWVCYKSDSPNISDYCQPVRDYGFHANSKITFTSRGIYSPDQPYGDTTVIYNYKEIKE